MVSEIFKEWIVAFARKMILKKRKVVLFVDNCPSHPHSIQEKLKNVKLIFFPLNATSKLQPLDPGIIKNVKMLYQNQIIRKMISLIENG